MAIPYKTILLPLDGSDFSKQALPHAQALAAQSQAQLILMQVVPYLAEEIVAAEPLPLSWRDLETQQHQQVDEARRWLQEIAVRLGAQQIECKSVVEVGHAADRIVDYAKEHAVDLIVMSTHGRTGLQRWLMGSVAGKVAAGAACPVLLVRPG